jgi:hypothetical protein
LLPVGLGSTAMTVYRIDPQSGALSVAKQYSIGQQPNWIEILDLRCSWGVGTLTSVEKWDHFSLLSRSAPTPL